MSCEQVSELLESYGDGEFTNAIQAREIQAHLDACSACREKFDAQKRLGSVVREFAAYHSAPDRLLQSIAAIGAVEPERPKRSINRGLLVWSFANLCWSAAALFLVLFFWPGHKPGQSLVSDLVSGHIRSLQAQHLFDVPSSDRHTVKPWFQGRLNFSPDVPNLASDGFPLVGGRLDTIGGHPVAALVYMRGKHTINVFVMPAVSGSQVSSASQSGYHLIHWSEHGLEYWAVSDTDSLPQFRDRFLTETQP